MAPKTKLCLGCNQQFEGRPNAKACSSKCRKRIFRAKQAISREVNKLAELRADLQHVESLRVPDTKQRNAAVKSIVKGLHS